MDPQSPLAEALKFQARSNAAARRELAKSRSDGNGNFDGDASGKYFVYALLLQEGKIYVGSTDNVYQRLYDHFNMTKSTAAWVRLHGPPSRVLEIVADAAPGDEDAVTEKYIAMFGLESVRGGRWHPVFSPPNCNTNDVRVSGRAFKSLSRAEIEDVVREIAALSAAVRAPENLAQPSLSLPLPPPPSASLMTQ
jgi:predicted GIY-YIG superfamily endonuclease